MKKLDLIKVLAMGLVITAGALGAQGKMLSISLLMLIMFVGCDFFTKTMGIDYGAIGGTEGDGTDITSKFSDAIFREKVYAAIGKKAPAPILDTDAKKIETLDVFNKNIASLAGIEYFTALTWLDCSKNQLTTLDVSKNTKLQTLWCYGNQLEALDMSKNTALTWLICYANQLTTLDISKNTALTRLWCYDNKFTTLNVTGLNALRELDVSNNYLSGEDKVIGLNKTITTNFVFGSQNP